MDSRLKATYQHKIFGEDLSAMGQGDSEHLLEVTARESHVELQGGNLGNTDTCPNCRAGQN